tara:strand:+ start:462 stop:2330 length:1869 start_codon:yes stop_codon:yes gene_type:complete
VAEAVVTLRVDASGATTALRNVQNQTNKLTNASKGTTKALHGTSAAAKGLGASLAASIGPLLTLGAAFATVGNAIGTFTARDRDIKILQQGLKNLGASAGDLRDLQQAADLLGRTTLFNEEDFTRGFNLLTSFRNIGVDSYERVAQAAADIAQVNQVDVSTSFMQLAKALQDPERNLSNLNRSGIAFTKQQTEVIKQLMKTNQIAEAHAMILDIVDESYNKLAQAAAGGFAGSVDTLGESFRDFSEVLGKALVPVIEPVIKGLTQLLTFLTTEGGQATLILVGIGSAIKTISVVAPLAGKAVVGLAAKIGALKIAVLGLSGAIAASGIGALLIAAGLLTTQIIKTKNAQKELNDAINTGSQNEVTKEIEKQEKILEKINERLENANGRTKKNLEEKKKEVEADIRMLKGREKTLESDKLINDKLKERVDIQKKNTEEIEKQQKETDKLKDKMEAVGEEIERSIKDNLREAITGAQSFGEAMTNVLNRIRDKIIDAQLDKLLGSFGENFGKSASEGGGKGLGGILGGILGGLFKANGGPVRANQPYIVGERRPELFVPRTSGTIMPTVPMGGESVVNNISVSVDATGSAVSGSSAEGNQLGQQIAIAIQSELIKQKRAGGLLS